VPDCPALFQDLTGVATFYDADGAGIDFPVDLRITDVHGHLVQDDAALSQVTPGLVTPLAAQPPSNGGCSSALG